MGKIGNEGYEGSSSDGLPENLTNVPEAMFEITIFVGGVPVYCNTFTFWGDDEFGGGNSGGPSGPDPREIPDGVSDAFDKVKEEIKGLFGGLFSKSDKSKGDEKLKQSPETDEKSPSSQFQSYGFEMKNELEKGQEESQVDSKAIDESKDDTNPSSQTSSFEEKLNELEDKLNHELGDTISIKLESKIELGNHESPKPVESQNLSDIQFELKESEKNPSNYMYQNEKAIRGSEFKLFNDQTIELNTTGGRSGLTLSTELYEWFKLPQEKNDSKIKVIANYETKTINGKIAYNNVESVISNNGFTTTIRPINFDISKMFKDCVTIRCIIPGELNGRNQLSTTRLFETASKIYSERTILTNNTDLTKIVSGEQGNTRFDIYESSNGTIVINNICWVHSRGLFTFSDKIADYIANWQSIDKVIASINGNTPKILKLQTRQKDGYRLIKECYVRNYGQPIKEVSIRFTSPELKLTEKAITDKNLKEDLKNSGYNVENVRTDFRNIGRHHNPEVEKNIRNLITESYGKNSNVKIFNETEITFGTNYNPSGNKHIYDTMVITYNEQGKISSIKTFEIKTSIGKNPTTNVKNAIYENLHFKSRLGKESTSIIITKYESKSDKINNFAIQNGIVLIDNKILSQTKGGKLDLSKYIESVESKIKNNVSNSKIVFHGFEFIENEGRSFENEIKNLMESEGYKVASNAVFRHNGQKIEIDLITQNELGKIIISCRDAEKITDKVSLKKTINNRANKVEYRMKQLKADAARLYVKVNSNLKEDMKKLYEREPWAEKVDIYIK